MDIKDEILKEFGYDKSEDFLRDFGVWIYMRNFRLDKIKNPRTQSLGDLLELYIKDKREIWEPSRKKHGDPDPREYCHCLHKKQEHEMAISSNG